MPYSIRAYFSNGSHSDSEVVVPAPISLNLNAQILPGPSNQFYLALGTVPPDLDRVRFGWLVPPLYGAVSADLYASNFVSGIAPIPWATNAALGWMVCQLFSTNGAEGIADFANVSYAEEDEFFTYPPMLYNAARHMKENLMFLLRAASTTTPFTYLSGNAIDGLMANTMDYPDQWYLRPVASTNYEYSGYDIFTPGFNSSVIQTLRPVGDNYMFRNFAFSEADLNQNGDFFTGVYWDWLYFIRKVDSPPTYLYDRSQAGLGQPLTNSAVRWIYSTFGDVGDTEALAEAGLYIDANTNVVLSSDAKNVFGLPISSVLYKTDHYVSLAAGNSAPAPDYGAEYFTETPIPQLGIVDYYFVSQTPLLRQYGWPYTNMPQPAIPGSPTFSPTNAQPPIIANIGEAITISGWAKMTISNSAFTTLGLTNSSSAKFAYLQQYFDKAYKVDTNGVVTTNQTGVLSPYGEFFPTEPGQVALVTMPDIDTGQRGTGIVTVVKLQLDVNHDGVMDLSFAGPDNTSRSNAYATAGPRPFVFWLNNDYDRDIGLDEDDVADQSNAASSPYTHEPVPDCEYRNNLGDRVIPSVRDVEDFARLWIAGLSTNVIASFPTNVTADLSWGDVGNPNPSNPTIDIVGTADQDGGIGYLTNYFTAQQQVTRSSGGMLRLGPGDTQEVVFNTASGLQFWNRAVWCGAKVGSGALTLTFKQGGIKIAETKAYIEIKDIKGMYERWTVGDAPSMAPTNQPYLAWDGLPSGAVPFQYGPSDNTNTPYILLVHDYNLPPWKKDRYAETAFKRLYWQGYPGRFGVFRWPDVALENSQARCDSESNAWASASGLLNLLTSLNTLYPNKVYLMAHGYGAIAAGEALQLAGTNIVVNRYIAMQGAVASHAYDASIFPRTISPSQDDGTPNRYAMYYVNGAPPYFYGVGGAGTYINYYNTNDNVLTNFWRGDQDAKPAFNHRWNGSNFYRGILPGLILLFPLDRYEIFAYCDEARCEAIGAQPNLAGPFVIAAQVNISTLSSPSGATISDHNGQFKSYCADNWAFWHAVFIGLGPLP
jgi:hypothetical protein